MMLFLPSLLALLGGVGSLRIRSRRARNCFLMGAVTAASLAVLLLLMDGSAPDVTLLRIPPCFSLAFRVDPVNRIFLGLVAVLWPLATLYAFEYMTAEEREPRFFAFFLASYAVTVPLALSANLFTLYLGYECLTLITLPLVTHREDGDSLRAGMVYLEFTVGGAALGLICLILLAGCGVTGEFVPGGSLDPARMAGREEELRLAFLLGFMGFGAKAAVFPLSFWLPRASVAPTPVTGLLHAVAVVNAGVFACLRLLYDGIGPAPLAGSWAQTAAQLLSVFTILAGAVMAVRERHLKRRLAWSTVYHLSYMLFSASLMTPAGLRGALTHLVFHGIMKLCLFFCSGAFLIRAGTEYLPQVRGLGRRMPRTVGCFVLAGASLTGIPPLIGFQSKWAILSAAMESGTWTAWLGVGAVLISSVLACVYLLEPAVQMIFQPPESAAGSDPSGRMLLPLFLLSLCMVLFGIWTAPLAALLQAAAPV